jgi:beta-lactamase superfamily II metal-dependent hydrolase
MTLRERAVAWWSVVQVVGVVMVTAGCGPAVLQVEPTTAAPGEPIEIYGTGFDGDVVARLVLAGRAVQLEVISQTAGSVEARLPGATPAGLYDVVISSDGVEATLPAALTVLAGRAHIRFLDVGQGDATLIVGTDGQRLLIDGGPAAAAPDVARAVDEVGGIDHVMVSHTDADHLAGVVALLAGDDGVAGTSDDVVPQTRWLGHDDGLCESNLCRQFRSLRADFEQPLVGDTLELGGVRVEVVGRDGDFGRAGTASVADENERSLAVVVSFSGRRVFIGGDLTGGGLSSVNVEAVAGAAVGPVDVLRVNHHGSATSSSAAFLAALQPAVAVVSTGTDNAFCHPEPGVLARLADAGPTIFATGRGIVADGGRCGGITSWPSGSAPGRGTITLTIDADGALFVDDEAF